MSATPNAPTSLQELKELLKDDNKVKVAGRKHYFGGLDVLIEAVLGGRD